MCKKCSVCGREVDKLWKGMCSKHYQQVRNYGKVLDNNPRTKCDPNEIIIYEDYAEVVLYDIRYNEIAKTEIDLDDINKIKDMKWHLLPSGYVVSKIKNKTIYLHRFVMDYGGNLEVDHVNLNKLDNKKSNLRIVTSSENGMNRGLQKNNTSGVTGVCLNQRVNKWMAYIKVDYKNIHLGYFDTKEEAIKARQEAEIKYFGEYRCDAQ